MAKLYFKYGAMGSSKTAQALITKFNYEEKGMRVLLLKPAVDTRDGKTVVKSRIGLQSEALVFQKNENLYDKICYNDIARYPDVVIIDEAQFLTRKQVEQLRDAVDKENISVLCFGLRTDFQLKLFEGSKALFELAENISEIKSVCGCGNKASVNARIDRDGKVVTDGKQVEIGGNDKYVSMCYKCYNAKLNVRRRISNIILR